MAICFPKPNGFNSYGNQYITTFNFKKNLIPEFLAKIIARSRLWQIDLERCSGISWCKIQVFNRHFVVDPVDNYGIMGGCIFR